VARGTNGGRENVLSAISVPSYYTTSRCWGSICEVILLLVCSGCALILVYLTTLLQLHLLCSIEW
jgi:hypothetical protein